MYGTVQWLNMGVLALEFSGLNSSFQGLNFVWWWGMVPMKEVVKKEVLERYGQDSG